MRNSSVSLINEYNRYKSHPHGSLANLFDVTFHDACLDMECATSNADQLSIRHNYPDVMYCRFRDDETSIAQEIRRLKKKQGKLPGA